MFAAIAEFKRRLIERPLRELAYAGVGYLLIDIPVKATEETVISWCREELADRFGIARPSAVSVTTFLWHWIAPLLGVLVMMLLYHRGNIGRAAIVAPNGGISRPEERDFLPWFMVLAAIALFVIFERQPALIEGTPLVAGVLNFDGSPLGIVWDLAQFLADPVSLPTAITKSYSLSVPAKNLGDEEVTITAAYIISDVDSKKMEMKINTPPGPSYNINEILPVPPSAWINLIASFSATTESSLITEWGAFRAVIKYNGKTIKHQFDADNVRKAMASLHPGSEPHVSPKN
jgi:hypothetical protein